MNETEDTGTPPDRKQQPTSSWSLMELLKLVIAVAASGSVLVGAYSGLKEAVQIWVSNQNPAKAGAFFVVGISGLWFIAITIYLARRRGRLRWTQAKGGKRHATRWRNSRTILFEGLLATLPFIVFVAIVWIWPWWYIHSGRRGGLSLVIPVVLAWIGAVAGIHFMASWEKGKDGRDRRLSAGIVSFILLALIFGLPSGYAGVRAGIDLQKNRARSTITVGIARSDDDDSSRQFQKSVFAKTARELARTSGVDVKMVDKPVIRSTAREDIELFARRNNLDVVISTDIVKEDQGTLRMNIMPRLLGVFTAVARSHGLHFEPASAEDGMRRPLEISALCMLKLTDGEFPTSTQDADAPGLNATAIAHIQILRGLVAVSRHQLKDARNAFTQAVRCPDDEEKAHPLSLRTQCFAHLLLGNTYMNDQEMNATTAMEEAISNYTVVIEKLADNGKEEDTHGIDRWNGNNRLLAPAYHNRGLAYGYLGKIGYAQDDFVEALKQGLSRKGVPSPGGPHYLLARCHLDNGLIEHAEREARFGMYTAKGDDAQYGHCLAIVGICQRKKGLHKDAVKTLSDALNKIGPSSQAMEIRALAHENCGKALLHNRNGTTENDSQTAKEHFTKAQHLWENLYRQYSEDTIERWVYTAEAAGCNHRQGEAYWRLAGEEKNRSKSNKLADDAAKAYDIALTKRLMALEKMEEAWTKDSTVKSPRGRQWHKARRRIRIRLANTLARRGEINLAQARSSRGNSDERNAALLRAIEDLKKAAKNYECVCECKTSRTSAYLDELCRTRLTLLQAIVLAEQQKKSWEKKKKLSEEQEKLCQEIECMSAECLCATIRDNLNDIQRLRGSTEFNHWSSQARQVGQQLGLQTSFVPVTDF